MIGAVRLRDLRYLIAALVLIAFASYTIQVIQESQRLQAELSGRVGLLRALSESQRTFLTNPPESAEFPPTFDRLHTTLDELEQAPGLRAKTAAARSKADDLREALPDRERRTEARTELFLAVDDLAVAIQTLNRDVSLDLAAKWRAVQRIAVAACVLAVIMLVLLGVVRARGRAATRMRNQLEIALAETEAARRNEARASAAKSDFLATVSHEIRTPMTAILGTAELLSATPLRPAQYDHLEVIRSGGDALLRLINDVLDLSQFEAGRLDIVPERFDPEALLDGVALLFAAAATERGVVFAVVAGPGIPARVVADAGRIRQVLVNLVGNAIKFTSMGHVVVRVTHTDGRLRFAVEDTGPGIPPDALERVFKAFEQVDSSRTRAFGGTGLGLAIARRLVEAMGGVIDATSTLGRGSSFTFEIPVEIAADPKSVNEGPYLVVGPAEKTEFAVEQLSAWGLTGRALERIPPGTALSGFRVVHLVPLGNDGDIDPRPNDLPGPVRPRGLRRTLAGSPAISGSVRLSSSSSNTPHRRGRLLIVDDNQTNRRVISSLLERLGWSVDCADGGREALNLAEKHVYQLVFMDCDMPGMDGLETTEELRGRGGPWSGLPIVGLSGHAGDEARERGMEAGMTDYLAKPVRMRTLKDALDRWVPDERRAP